MPIFSHKVQNPPVNYYNYKNEPCTQWTYSQSGRLGVGHCSRSVRRTSTTWQSVCLRGRQLVSTCVSGRTAPTGGTASDRSSETSATVASTSPWRSRRVGEACLPCRSKYRVAATAAAGGDSSYNIGYRLQLLILLPPPCQQIRVVNTMTQLAVRPIAVLVAWRGVPCRCASRWLHRRPLGSCSKRFGGRRVMNSYLLFAAV